MDNKEIAKNSLYRVMGVNSMAEAKTVQSDLDNPQWDKAATLKYLGATLVQIAALA